MVKAWPKPKLICDIKIFFRFTNFYKRFIKGFSKIVALLIIILKISHSASTRPSCTKLDKNGLHTGSGGGNEGIKNLLTFTKLAKSKKLDFAKAKLLGMDFLTFEAKKTLIYL